MGTERTFERLLELVSAINRTNSKTGFDNEHSTCTAGDSDVNFAIAVEARL